MDAARQRREGQYRDGSNLDARLALHQRFSTNPGNWHRWVFEHLELRAGDRVLEVGAGLGTLWLENADRAPAIRLVLSDGSPGMAAETRAKLPGAWEVVDVEAIPHPDASFDAVLANHMLYYPERLDVAIAELHRVLRPGGTLYATTNGTTHLQELLTIATECIPGYTGFSHLQRFGLDNGAEMIKAQFGNAGVERYDDGLVVTEVEPLVAYLASMRPDPTLDMGPIRQRVQEEFERGNGVVSITKDAGLITAKPTSAAR